MERFFKTYKSEEASLTSYRSLEELHFANLPAE
jgi:hypothetical protein